MSGVTIKIDTKEFDAAIKKLALTEQDMLNIEKPGALAIVNKQRELVPVKTAATKTSIIPDIQNSSATKVEDHIGPSTNYAPAIELGIPSRPNYPIQPFVRPSVFGNKGAVTAAISAAFKAVVTRG